MALRSCLVASVVTRGGPGAGGRRPGLHRRQRGDAAQHPVRRALGPRAAGGLPAELVGPAVPPALRPAAAPLAAGGGGAGLPVLRVLGAEAAGALTAVAAAAAPASAAASATSALAASGLAVAAHAAAGAVASGRGRRLALLPPRRLPAPVLLFFCSRPLAQVEGRDQRAGALSGGAGGGAAHLIGHGGLAATALVIGEVEIYRVTL